MRRATILLTIIALLGSSGSASAGKLVESRVAGTANWVAHLNLEHLAKSELGQLIRAELNKQGLEQQLQGFEEVFSFHPIEDIRNVTIYGTGDNREKAVALFEGAFDRDKLVALVQMNPEYEETRHSGMVVHSWVDENKKDPNAPDQRMYGCAYKNMVVLGAGLDAVKKAVDVLKGSAPAAVFEQKALTRKGAFVQVAANAVKDLAEHKNEAALFEKTDRFGGVMGEKDGNFYVELSLRAESQEIAQNVTKMLEGLLALLTLAGNEQPALAEAARQFKFSCVDRTVMVNLEASSESVFNFLKEQWEAQQRKKQNPTAQ